MVTDGLQGHLQVLTQLSPRCITSEVLYKLLIDSVTMQWLTESEMTALKAKDCNDRQLETEIKDQKGDLQNSPVHGVRDLKSAPWLTPVDLDTQQYARHLLMWPSHVTLMAAHANKRVWKTCRTNTVFRRLKQSCGASV